MSLKDNCNKEIFLVYNEEKNDNDIPVKVEIISEFMELVEHVKSLIYSIDSGTKILHGLLTRAFSLPKNLKGKSAYIIINNGYNTDRVLIMESGAQSDKDLADTIDALLAYNTTGFTVPLKLENMYIFYGYELSITLSLDEEEVDEEAIDVCQEIVNDIKIIDLLTNNQAEK